LFRTQLFYIQNNVRMELYAQASGSPWYQAHPRGRELLRAPIPFSGQSDPKGALPCVKKTTYGALVLRAARVRRSRLPACRPHSPAATVKKWAATGTSRSRFAQVPVTTAYLSMAFGVAAQNNTRNLDQFLLRTGQHPAATDRNGRSSIHVPNKPHPAALITMIMNFSPRWALSYDINGDGTTSLRGGYAAPRA